MFGMDAKAKGWVTAAALLVSVFMAGVLSAAAILELGRGLAVAKLRPAVRLPVAAGVRLLAPRLAVLAVVDRVETTVACIHTLQPDALTRRW